MVTISDIASALGVTPSTVSRALAGSPRVKAETRAAVDEMARKMGYERNIVASNLRKGRSDIVGVVVPLINREFFANIIGGAESVLNAAGYNVLICQTKESFESEVKALRTLRNYHVAAIMISHSIESENGDHIREIIGERMPLVQFDRVFPDLPGVKIVGENFEGAYKATKYLIEQGYKKIGTLAGYMTCLLYRERLEGYRKAIEDSGMEYDESIVFHDTIVYDKGRESCLKAIDAGCDALYSAGDFSALGAIDELMLHGIDIPSRFGIIGTANESFTALMTPSLSSLGQHPYEMGQAAARAFLEGRTDTEVIPMELLLRQSSNRNNDIQCQK